jgi:hypothetical protein
MNKLLVCFPTYHHIPAKFFTRYLVMDKNNVVGNMVVDGVYLPISMQVMVDQALKSKNWDRLVTMEQDTLPPEDAFNRLDAYTKEHHIVGSMYFKHSKPHDVVCYIQEKGTLRHNSLTPETVKAWCSKPGLYECSAVGLGFTSISREVLENWDKNVPMFQCDNKEIDFGSHDLWFCYQARKQGFKVYIDSGMQCDHLTEVAIGLKDNQREARKTKGRSVVEFSYEAPQQSPLKTSKTVKQHA